MNAADKENETATLPQPKLVIPNIARTSKNPLVSQNPSTVFKEPSSVTKKAPVSVKKTAVRIQRTPRVTQKTPQPNHKPLSVIHTILTSDQNTDPVEQGIPPVAERQTPLTVHKAAPADQNAPLVDKKTTPITQKRLPHAQNASMNYRTNLPVDPKTPQFHWKKLPSSRVLTATSSVIASCSLTPLFHRLKLQDEKHEQSSTRPMGVPIAQDKCVEFEQLPTETLDKQADLVTQQAPLAESEQNIQEQHRPATKRDMGAQTDEEDVKLPEELVEDATTKQAEQHFLESGEQLTQENMETWADGEGPIRLGQITKETMDTQSEQQTRRPQGESAAMDTEAQMDVEEQQQLWQYIEEAVVQQSASNAELGYRGLYERVAARAIELEGIEEEHVELCELVGEAIAKQNTRAEDSDRVGVLAHRVIQDLMRQVEEKNLQLEESTQMLDNARVMMSTLCNQLRANAERLRQELRNTTEQLSEERAEWATERLRLEDECSVRSSEVDATRAELALLQKSLWSALEELTTEKNHVHRLTDERRELTSRVENIQFLEIENKFYMDERVAWEERLSATCRELKALRTSEGAARDETRDLRSELAQAEREVTALRKELHAKEQELQGIQEAWTASGVRAEQETAYLQECYELKLQLQKCEERLTDACRDRHLAQVDVEMLKEELLQLASAQEPKSDKTEDWVTEKIQLKQELSRMTQMKLEKEVELGECNRRYKRHRYVLEENEKLANIEVGELQSLIGRAMQKLQSASAHALGCKAVVDTMDLLSTALIEKNEDGCGDS
ncbi:sperm-associated antigen 5 isoform X2 [Lethenteron reissneri]|uniref:sperm-associated antigen 5 isoform X2 n=1 Tax=Lethenteron reissneri TaxID=7753 RepID=UPI002AB76FEB|nr:sperm-associated antigen 5 isoform X2 [Lethenteron reissneri]